MIALYPDEATIAREVLGEQRADQWPGIARYLEEKKGFPRIDPMMGGRYWPAVERFFRIREGLETGDTEARSRVIIVPPKPDREVSHVEKEAAPHRRWSSRRAGRSRP